MTFSTLNKTKEYIPTNDDIMITINNDNITKEELRKALKIINRFNKCYWITLILLFIGIIIGIIYCIYVDYFQ